MTEVYPRAMLADLARSGLTAADANRMQLKFELFPVKDSTAAKMRMVESYRIPYSAPDGTSWAPRWKLLEAYRAKGDKHDRKYMQLPNTPPHLYLPPYFEWSKITNDVEQDLWIVEGEKKAAAVCKLGLPALAIGGVWNWLLDGSAIEDFALFNFQWRKSIILFDSDAEYKTQVHLARERLADTMLRFKSRASICHLPPLPGQAKTGADDFVVYHKAKAKLELLKLPRTELFIPTGYTATELAAAVLPKPNWVIPELIVSGLTVVAGPPKTGKSWLALMLGMMISAGTPGLGGTYKGRKGDVLYLALEDTYARLKARLARLQAAGYTLASSLHLHTSWPQSDHYGIEALEQFMIRYPHCKTVIVDTFVQMRARRSKDADLYQYDADTMGTFKRLADRHGVALILFHHLNKNTTAGIFDRFSGSSGLTGGADTLIALDPRTVNTAVLEIKGRDLAPQSIAIESDNGVWKVLGDAAVVATEERQTALFAALKNATEPMTLVDLRDATGQTRSAIYRALATMIAHGVVVRAGKTAYQLVNKAGVQEKKY
jgi:hypothetical protein